MSDEIKRKSPTEILNEKYKSCMPSEFEGKVWDNKLIEAMHEFANQQQKPLSAEDIDIPKFVQKFIDNSGKDIFIKSDDEMEEYWYISKNGKVGINLFVFFEMLLEDFVEQYFPKHPLTLLEMEELADKYSEHPMAKADFYNGLMKANELIFKLTNK